jgi:oxygen-dependent protoporphyrinogen oxidase
MKSAKVIGAGFTGTMTAYLLSHQGYEVTVYDPAPRPGGLISTQSLPQGDFETAANGFLANSWIEEVAEAIGVKLIAVSPVAKKNRYLWSIDPKKPGPQKWPLTFIETLGFGFRLIWNLLTQNAAPRPLETLEHWGKRVLGEPATQKVLETAVLGIYASPIAELSASLIVGRFFKKGPKQKRSQLKGTIAPEKGMGEWFSKMHTYLEARGVKFNQSTHPALHDAQTPTWICTSAPDAAALLEHLAPDLAQKLRSIRMLPVVSVAQFFQAEVTRPTPQLSGFGCLFHPRADFQSLGVLWSSDLFPHRFDSKTRAETWILGGKIRPSIIDLSDEEILKKISEDRARFLDSKTTRASSSRPPIHDQITRWQKAFPLYDLELEKILESLPQPPPGIRLCGNYLGRLGLSQIALELKTSSQDWNT